MTLDEALDQIEKILIDFKHQYPKNQPIKITIRAKAGGPHMRIVGIHSHSSQGSIAFIID